MNIWTFLQVLGAALITALQFNIYLGAYMGMDRGRRDRIYLGLNILNMFFLRVLINTSIQLDAPAWLRAIIYIFGFVMMLVGVVLYRKECMVINLVSFMVGIMTFDLVTVTMSAVIEELFGYAYNDTPVLYSAKALLVWLGVEALREGIGTIIEVWFMRTFMPYRKFRRQSFVRSMVWILAVGTGYMMLVVYFVTMVKEVNLMSQFIALGIWASAFIATYHLYTIVYNSYQRKMIRFLEAKMKQQKEDYEKLLADYNRLRDIKHDLYNYVHILDLAGDVRKEQEQIRQLQEDLKPGKQKEYIKYTNLSILNLVLNNVTSACEGAGIHPEVAAEEIQIDTNVELDMGYLIERMVHNVILLNEDQGENKQDSVSESLSRTLRIQIAPSESSDGNIQVVLKGIGLRMKGIEMNSDNRKEIRNNKQIIQFIMERHEGFQWNNRKESHLYLTA